jgi:hypothetical protein
MTDHRPPVAGSTILERANKYADALLDLVERGNLLLRAMQNDCYPKQFEVMLTKLYGKDKEKAEEYRRTLPSFNTNYQGWYSEAQAVIKQVLPDRLMDFESYYEHRKPRKSIDFQNYMIRDYLQGLQVKRLGDVIVDGSAAIPEFEQQLSLLKAAQSVLGSTLLDLRAVLQADLFDSELAGADALFKSGFFRAAGVICGVVLEKHLSNTCSTHNVKVSKRHPTISDFNQALKDADVLDVPQWRQIQQLADIRNICGHAKDREPRKDEIDDIVAGTKKVIKTIF